MPRSNFKYVDGVERRLRMAADRYALEAGSRVARSFVLQVQAAVRSAARNPLHYEAIDREKSETLRRTLVDVFPYVVLYEVMDDYILVLDIYHTARGPDYIQGVIDKAND